MEQLIALICSLILLVAGYGVILLLAPKIKPPQLIVKKKKTFDKH